MSTTRFYTSLVNGSSSVDAVILQKAYAKAVEEKDLNLAAAVVLRNDCPGDVLKKALKSRNLQIRGAYHRRPASEAELQGRLEELKQEKAQGALELVARAGSTPQVMREYLAEHGTPLVLAAIVANRDVSGALRRKALYRLDAESVAGRSLTPSQMEAFTTELRTHPVGAVAEGEEAAVAADEDLAVVFLNYNLVPTPDQHATTSYWIEHGTPQGALPAVLNRVHWLPVPEQERLAQLGRTDILIRVRYGALSEELRKETCSKVLAAALNGQAEAYVWMVRTREMHQDPWGKEAVLRLVTDEKAPDMGHRDELVDILTQHGLIQAAAEAKSPVGELARVRVGASSKEIDDIVTDRIEDQTLRYDYSLQNAIILSENLSEETAVRLICAGIGDSETLVGRNPSTEVIAAQLAHVGHHAHKGWDLLKKSSDVDTVVEQTCKHLKEEGPLRSRNGYSRDHRAKILQKLEETGLLGTRGHEAIEDMIGTVPARELLQYETEGYIATKIAAMTAAALTSKEAWESFEVLAPECEGSYSELLSVSRMS